MPALIPTRPIFEHVMTEASDSFVWRRDDYPWKRNVWNTHPEYEIHLIRNASGVALIGDHVGHFEPGYLAIVGSNLPHDWVSATAPGELIEGRDIVLQFDAERLRASARLLPELGELDAFLQRALRGLVFRGETRRAAADLLEAMGNVTGIERLAMFLRLLAIMAKSDEYDRLSSDGFAPDLDPATMAMIQRMLNFMVRNYTADIRLADLADIAVMSESACSRFFKKNSGNSFSEHLTKLRIGRACALLGETAMPITELCFAVGYDNLSNFNRTFRRERGATPSAYRRLVRQRKIGLDTDMQATRVATRDHPPARA